MRAALVPYLLHACWGQLCRRRAGRPPISRPGADQTPSPAPERVARCPPFSVLQQLVLQHPCRLCCPGLRRRHRRQADLHIRQVRCRPQPGRRAWAVACNACWAPGLALRQRQLRRRQLLCACTALQQHPPAPRCPPGALLCSYVLKSLKAVSRVTPGAGDAAALSGAITAESAPIVVGAPAGRTSCTRSLHSAVCRACHLGRRCPLWLLLLFQSPFLCTPLRTWLQAPRRLPRSTPCKVALARPP